MASKCTSAAFNLGQSPENHVCGSDLGARRPGLQNDICSHFGASLQNHVCCFHVGARLPKSRLLLSFGGKASQIAADAVSSAQGLQVHICCFHVGAKLPKSRLLLSFWGKASQIAADAVTSAQGLQVHVCCFLLSQGFPNMLSLRRRASKCVREPAALDNLFVDKPRPLESRTALGKQNGCNLCCLGRPDDVKSPVML